MVIIAFWMNRQLK